MANCFIPSLLMTFETL